MTLVNSDAEYKAHKTCPLKITQYMMQVIKLNIVVTNRNGAVVKMLELIQKKQVSYKSCVQNLTRIQILNHQTILFFTNVIK